MSWQFADYAICRRVRSPHAAKAPMMDAVNVMARNATMLANTFICNPFLWFI